MNMMTRTLYGTHDNHRDEEFGLGWESLFARAGSALTRFETETAENGLETVEDQAAMAGNRWALLPADVEDDGQRIEVSVEIPGMETQGFEVSVHEDRLFIRGSKQPEKRQRRGRRRLTERAYGAFERVIELPAMVNDEGAKARYRRGVLRISLPKAEEARARRITVETA